MSWDELPHDIRVLADALLRHESTQRTGEALSAEVGRLTYQWKKDRSLSACDVPVPIPRNKGLHPTGCGIHQAFISFAFSIGQDDPPIPERAEFQVRVMGNLEADDMLLELEDHWRVDTHVFDDNGEGEPRNANAENDEAQCVMKQGLEPHALFHFQRGGHAQDTFAAQEFFVPGMKARLTGSEWKALFQSPGPRIPTIPMDPLIAIDFCIGQHDGIVWRALRDVPEYFGVIEKAQRRLWSPIFKELASAEFRGQLFGPLLLI